jgi:hypothetical protein
MNGNLPELPSRLLTDIETAAWQEILAGNARSRETLPRCGLAASLVATARLRACNCYMS